MAKRYVVSVGAKSPHSLGLQVTATLAELKDLYADALAFASKRRDFKYAENQNSIHGFERIINKCFAVGFTPEAGRFHLIGEPLVVTEIQ